MEEGEGTIENASVLFCVLGGQTDVYYVRMMLMMTKSRLQCTVGCLEFSLPRSAQFSG